MISTTIRSRCRSSVRRSQLAKKQNVRDLRENVGNAKRSGLVPIEKTLAMHTTITRMNMTKRTITMILPTEILMPTTGGGMQTTLSLGVL